VPKVKMAKFCENPKSRPVTEIDGFPKFEKSTFV
jgi:hypothetical protein